MSQLIITTDVSSIRPVFSEGTSENIKRYDQLKKLFENSDEYKILAKPVQAGGQKVAWHTEYEGKIIPYRKLDEEDQETAKGLLKAEVNKMYKTIVSIIDDDAQRKKLFDLIDSCIEIPDFDDVYLVQNASGQKNFCLVRWGFINEDFNAPKHLIANLVSLKVASLNIKAIKGNNKTAIDEKIFFEFDNKVEEFTTNGKGKIFLEDIRLLTKITAYQLDEEGNRIYEHKFKIENDAEITFFIGNQTLPKQNVSIQTLDNDDNIIANETIKIQYDDVEFIADTNSQGIIQLGELFIDTKVVCSQLKNEKVVKTAFIDVKQGKNIYFINIVKYKNAGTVQIRVIDENFELIPFAKIQVKFPDKTIKYFESNEKGLFDIENIPFKKDIIFRQIIDKLPQFQQIMIFTDDDKIFDFKGKSIKSPYDCTILILTVVNSNNEPIPNLKVEIQNGINSFNQITNSDGNVILKEIDCSKKTFAKVEDKGKRKQEEITCSGNETTHTIQLGKKIGLWWLLILLIAVIIGLGILFLPKIIGTSSDEQEDTTQTIVTVDTNIVETYSGMKFFVIDEEGNSLSDAQINITVGDSIYTKSTNSEGEVIFDKLLDSNKYATAIITAPKFTKQRLTFKISSNKTITMSTQSIEISEQVLPCGTQVESKGYHSTIQTFNLKKPKGSFKLLYDMFNIADKIIVYKGSASDISPDRIIWQSPGFEKRLHSLYVNFETVDSLITVEIQGGDTTRTEWYFTVYCPN